MSTQQLIEERQTQYNDAWLHTGIAMNMTQKPIYSSNLFTGTPFAHNWVIILSKLFRALHSPYNKDHWEDIQGYCQLILDYIAEGNEE